MPVVEIESVEHFDDLLYNRSVNGNQGHNKLHLAVDFKAVWCGPCKRFAPTFEELSNTYGEYIYFCSVDVDDVQDLAVRYGIDCMPTFMLIDVQEPESEPQSEPDQTGVFDEPPAYDLIKGVAQGTKDRLENMYKFLTNQAKYPNHDYKEDDPALDF